MGRLFVASPLNEMKNDLIDDIMNGADFWERKKGLVGYLSEISFPRRPGSPLSRGVRGVRRRENEISFEAQILKTTFHRILVGGEA